ncbi:hypothetical protein GOP47_0007551 [Adiantum capillus-veneris]|uniref:Uncharacterized protein n=1 Tax=Adiantum capillus-veneris TaxID=13818 RepID=A0A9D4V2E0_ADICA|nr:hypothetical protein GOP47_0007551 [Adiantum capillus-veneris]
MGDDAGEGMEVVVESSWTVLKGSLESCVSVVFLDPETHEPIISSFPHSSTKLVLVPPAEPSPCEITVKFQQRLCHVQSVYTSSTARICEIYSRSNLETDPEYVCTVKGWVPCKDDFSSAEKSLEDGATKRGDGVLVQESDSPSENVEKFSISSGVSSMPVSNHDGDDECQKSVYSSGEDSWVNVKLNGSFSAESACASLMAPDLDNWHVPLNVKELVHLEDQLGIGLEAEKRGVENAVKLSDRSCEGKLPIDQVGESYLDMFEAEVELIDHSPWAAITIRLLSLQDKTVVEVDQMVFLAIAGSVPEPATANLQSDGREPTSALFAMFLPSLLQMAQGVSGNSKDLIKSGKTTQPCELKQDMMHVSFAGKDVCKASHQCTSLEELPILNSNATCPPSVCNVVESSSSKMNDLTEPECDQSSLLKLDADGNVVKRTVEPGDQTLPTCNCKEFVGDVIGKELAKTFHAFSERFDRLESLYLRLESFLHRSFEGLDERIRSLEGQHSQDFVETNSASKHLGTLSDVSTVQNDHNDYPRASESKEEVLSALPQSADQGHSAMQPQSNDKFFARDPLLDQTESGEEVSSTLIEPDHSEIQHVVNEAVYVKDAVSHSVEFENLINDTLTDVQGSSREPEVTVVNIVSKDRLPHASLDDAWASALSAFATSFPMKHSVTENNDTSIMNKQYSGSGPCDGSVSRSESKEFKEEGNGSSFSSYSDVIAKTNDVDNKVVSTSHGPTYRVSKEAACNEQMSLGQEAWGILPPSHSMTSKPVMTFDFLSALNGSRTPDQKKTSGVECVKSVDIVEWHDILLSSYLGAHEPVNYFDCLHPKEVQSAPSDLDVPFSQILHQQEAVAPSLPFDVVSSALSKSMQVAETLDDLGALGVSTTRLSPVFHSSSDINQVGAWNSISYTYDSGGDNQEMSNFNLSGGNGEYGSFQGMVASNTNAMCQRSFSLLYGESGALHGERSEEESLSNACLEVDFLSGHIFSGPGEALSNAEVQGPESSLRSFIREEAGNVLDLLDDSSNYQDGRTCSQDSLCFSQDFEACQNDFSDTRWAHAPNIFYMNDPELTDDEADNTAGALDERTESNDSFLQGDLSDTDTTEDLPFWPAHHNTGEDGPRIITVFPPFEDEQSIITVFPGFEDEHNAGEDEQPTIIIFPGFENLC